MWRETQDAQAARDVSLSPPVHFGDERVACVSCSKHFLRCVGELPIENFLDRHHREYFVTRIDERHFAIEFQWIVITDRQRDRYWKEMAVVEAHLGDDALIVTLSHKAVERTKSAHCEQLQIADRALGETHGRQCFRISQLFG